MTKVITRYFASEEQAVAVRKELVEMQRFSLNILRMFRSADGLKDALVASNVDAKAAKAYETKMKKGGAILMVYAGYKPLGVAQTFRDVTASMGAVDMGDVIQEATVKDKSGPGLSVMPGGPHMMYRRRDPSSTNHYMADWPIPLISRRKPFREMVIQPHGRMADWPVPLLSRRKPFTGSIIPRHGRMANFPLPLLSKRKPYDQFAFPRHKRMADFPIPLISKRKPFTGTLIGRHTRMANWPFPHLINGKTSTNALIPGGPRMANFPISLLSDRKPYTGSIVGKHARMANFPIGLISKRKPYTGSAIPRHGRMADFPLPLVIKHGEEAGQGGKGFSFSKMFGMPTLIRR